ncbi:CDP-glycerol glycerophosphotransferase family protein [Gracilimonas tropica]|uniref:CDP-glycerol glycerophosphotransferase family protein n=1 Tax=Gracilimonas tropica TaxID=454600 RepID=UPI00035D4048|nr:CDP-glycerol glycerophosphotransferase family protein [Gracilimonas tropica]
MKVLFYASTFGADLLAFALYLNKKPNVTAKVLLSDPGQFQNEGVAHLFPLKAELIKKTIRNYFFKPSGFKPDITIMDNKVPLRAPSPYGMMLWHGFGWKGPNDIKEFSWLHKSITAAWGTAMQPNDFFRWQCFGPWDFKHRTEVSGFHPDNCRVLGAASHDLLRNPLPKEDMQPYYPFDVVNKKTVLIAPTWHYGEVFSHWGSDADIFEKLLQRIDKHDANVILRLHDSFRFDKKYIRFTEELAERHPNTMLKFKDKNPDNLLDMMVSDALITNYSSIANLYYATGRPTIHVYPVKNEDEDFLWRKQTAIGTLKTTIDSVKYIWKLPPEEHGGMMAKNFDALINQVDRALEDPDCCKEQAQQFLDEYMLGADGKNCDRIWNSINELVNQKL